MKFDKTGLDGYITDRNIESETGVWIKFPQGRKFCILRAGGANKKFSRALQKAVKPYRRQLEKNTLDPDVADKLFQSVYARHVVIDWDGINDEDGTPVPCTPENIEAFFEAFPEIFKELSDAAGDMATFSEETLKEAAEVLGET